MDSLEEKTFGHIKVIRKQYNDKVKTMNDKYYLVEVNGQHRLMRYDNILRAAKHKPNKIKSNYVTPKEALLKYIDNNNDTMLGAIMLRCSLDIVNKLTELRRAYPQSYFAPLHHYIENYMNTETFAKQII